MNGPETTAATEDCSLYMAAAARFQDSIDCVERFFADHEGAIVDACEQLATRFRAGGRLFVFGSGASASDAQHVSVEFVHPVIVGKRALPAMALTTDIGSITDPTFNDEIFSRQIGVLADARDIALGLSVSQLSPSTSNGLAHAKRMGLLTIAATGGQHAGDFPSSFCDVSFGVPAEDPLIVQEVQETLYHVLWELVHIFLDHGGTNV